MYRDAVIVSLSLSLSKCCFMINLIKDVLLSCSYVGVEGKQLVASDNVDNVELGSGGSELIIKSTTDGKTSVKTLGSREFLRYYRQKPRPSPSSDIALAITLASRYKSFFLVIIAC